MEQPGVYVWSAFIVVVSSPLWLWPLLIILDVTLGDWLRKYSVKRQQDKFMGNDNPPVRNRSATNPNVG